MMRTQLARGFVLAAVLALVAACSNSGGSSSPAASTGTSAAPSARGKRGRKCAEQRRHDQDRWRLRADRRRIRARPAGRQRREAGGQGDQRRGRHARQSDRLHRPRQPVQDGCHGADGQAVRRAGQGSVDDRLHGHRLRPGVRPDLPEREDPVHHRRRDVAEDPDPGRRHDVPGLLRRQRPGGGRRRILVLEVRQERLLPVGQGRRVHDAPRPVLQDALHRARRDDRPRGVVRRQGDRLLGADRQDQDAQPGAGLLLRRGDALQHRPDRQAVPRRRPDRARSSAATATTRRTSSRSPGRPRARSSSRPTP